MQEQNSLKLNLGCGATKLTGFINIDSVKEFDPDLLHDISQPLPYSDCSVDEIIADGLLEHFDKYIRFVVFCEWARVLKVGGTVNVSVPNVKKLLFRYFKFGFEKFVDTAFGENMLGSETYIGHFGNHKWGYSKDSLEAFVRLFGIEPVKVETSGLVLRLVGRKIQHIPQDQVDRIEIYSSANDCGVGKARMSVGEARAKIKIFNGCHE